MMNFNNWEGQMFGFHLQMLFCSLLFLAAVFLVVWAIRFAKKEELKKWIIGLLIVGLLGSVLSSFLGGFGPWGMRPFHSYGYRSMMNGQIWDCMQDNDCYEEMEDFMENMMGTEADR